MTKTDVKVYVKNEFCCPWDFVEYQNRFGVIDELKTAIIDEDQGLEREIMDELFEAYKDYCSAWDLDIQADNRKFWSIQYKRKDRQMIPPRYEYLKHLVKLQKERR